MPTNTDNKKCCYFDITENICKSDNYIILYYIMEKNPTIKMDLIINTEMLWVLLLMAFITILCQMIKVLQ